MHIVSQPAHQSIKSIISAQFTKRPGFWLFISMMLVNAGNYGFNVFMGRWLGPVAYAEINLIVTLFLVATFLTSGLQMGAARAIVGANNQHMITTLRRVAWACGGFSLFGLGLFASFWQTLFQTASPLPFIILGAGLTCYYALGVERGIAQGCTHFGRLAWNFQLEMGFRLIGALLLVTMGMGVIGATIAFSSSIILAWVSMRRYQPALTIQATTQAIQITTLIPIMVHLLGQVLINNSDVLLVKVWFPAHSAGQYAALALIGRVVFFATATVGTILFPRVLRSPHSGEQQRLFWYSMLITVGISGLITAVCKAIPELILVWLFGAAYLPMANVLWLYGAATSCYALANIIITYQLAQDRSFGAWATMIAGITQIAVIAWMHQSIIQIVYGQIAVMIGFLGLLIIDEIRRSILKTSLPR
jgi:O-antigen/teichoic acid export membrane protein